MQRSSRPPSRPSSRPAGRKAKRPRWALLLVAIGVVLLWAALLASRNQRAQPAITAGSPNSAASERSPGRPAADDDDGEHGASLPRDKSGAPSATPPAAAKVLDAPGAQGSVEGHVRSREDGRAVARAELSFEHAGTLLSVRSQADGSYRFEPRTDGSWRLVSVEADGYLPFAPEWGQSALLAHIEKGKRVTGTTLWLAPTVDYTGLVVDPQGAPVARADVRLFAQASDAALMPLEDRFHSDARGEFRFRAPIDSVLEARHPRWGSARVRVDFAAEVSRRLVITLGAQRPQPPAQRITGRVLGPDGAPLDHAVVSAELEQDTFVANTLELPANAASDAEGQYELLELSPGKYTLRATRSDLSPVTLEGVQAGSDGVDLKLTQGGRLEGTVSTSDGSKLASFTVQAYRKTGPLTSDLVRSVSVLDPAGRFTVEGLPEGALQVRVQAPGFAPSGDLAVQISAAPAPPSQLQVVLSRGQRLAGKVTDLSSGAPIASARVTLEGRDGQDGSAPLRNTVQSDAQGQFVVEGVAPGSASLLVAAAGHHARALHSIAVPGPALEVALRPLKEGEKPQVELAGLGVVLAARGDALAVGALAPKGGGAEAGLKVGDLIVAVGGRLVTELGFEAAIAAIRGPENSSVVLAVRKQGAGEPVNVMAYRRLVRM